jgi:hypothetical protein
MSRPPFSFTREAIESEEVHVFLNPMAVTSPD